MINKHESIRVGVYWNDVSYHRETCHGNQMTNNARQRGRQKY
jgi:hypothetical protein